MDQVGITKDECGIIGAFVSVELDADLRLLTCVIAEDQAWYGVTVFDNLGGYAYVGLVNSTMRGIKKEA